MAALRCEGTHVEAVPNKTPLRRLRKTSAGTAPNQENLLQRLQTPPKPVGAVAKDSEAQAHGAPPSGLLPYVRTPPKQRNLRSRRFYSHSCSSGAFSSPSRCCSCRSSCSRALASAGRIVVAGRVAKERLRADGRVVEAGCVALELISRSARESRRENDDQRYLGRRKFVVGKISVKTTEDGSGNQQELPTGKSRNILVAFMRFGTVKSRS